MSKSQHTPAPWKWVEDKWNDGYSGLFGPDEQDVCVPLFRNDGDTGAAWFDPTDDPSRADEIAANFLLLSAAPELLAACEDALEVFSLSCSPHYRIIRDKLTSAITKAGGQP